MLRKTLITSPIVLAAVAIKKAEKEATQESKPAPSSPEIDQLAHYKCKPSELPLYSPLHSYNKPKQDQHPPKNSKVHETIESGVRVVRQEVQHGYGIVANQLRSLENYVDTAKAHTASSIDYLNQPHNVLPRSGAIAIGGIAGFIFAARGGFIKKVIYTTAGAGAIASLCYPRQAEQFAKDVLYEARKGYAITYNFVKGVKPSEAVPIEPISKFPTTLEDLKYLMWDLYDEGKEMVFGDKKKKQ